MAHNVADAARSGYRGPARLPGYDRSGVTTGIVHIGVGNFHRSHQAFYLDRLLGLGSAREWGICGVGVLPSDERMRDALRAQDGLYTLLTKSPDGSIDARVVGSLVDYLWVPDDPEAVIERLAHPATRIVTLTVTEGGYGVDPATGRLRTDDPGIAADAAGEGPPRRHFRLLHESLRLRRDRGIPPFTVASCDNIHGNGSVARRTLLDYIAMAEPEFADWVQQNVAFPNSMVDRITPITTDEDRAITRDRFGIEDAWPVPAESFTQWVLEDRFPLGRPPLEQAGVELVPDVIPYELMKMRLLNASHQVIGLFSALRGHRYVHEAMRDPLIHAAVAQFQQHEAEPTLTPIPGVDFAEYRRSLLERFANPGIRDTIARLSSHTSTAMPTFIVPILRDQLAAGRRITVLAALVAAWAVRSEERDGLPVTDRQRESLHALATDIDPTAFVRNEEIFAELAHDERLVAEFARWRTTIAADGVEVALSRLTTAAAPQPERQEGGETQHQRAMRQISAMAEGADIAESASSLSNDFTDRVTARVRDWFSRLRNR